MGKATTITLFECFVVVVVSPGMALTHPALAKSPSKNKIFCKHSNLPIHFLATSHIQTAKELVLT